MGVAQVSPGLPFLVVILGPTGVGKTEISIQLAQRLSAEIVSADSRLLYRGMDVGTAKPSLADRQSVPHHLIDVTDPDQPWSLALFQQQAPLVIASIHRRDRLPFLVGGTGQYIRSVTQGWEIPKAEPHPRLRAALEAWVGEIGAGGLHTRLAVLDPQAAASIDARNVRRTVRALEVILSTGSRFSEQRLQGKTRYRLLSLGLTRPRPELYARVDARIEQMLDSGLVDEVRGLLANGFSPDLPAFSAIGYREIIAFLMGKLTLDDAIQQMRRATRVFIRRQANWFKADDPAIHWFQASPGTVNEMEKEIASFLVQ